MSTIMDIDYGSSTYVIVNCALLCTGQLGSSHCIAQQRDINRSLVGN